MSFKAKENISDNMTKHLDQLRNQIPGLLNQPFQFSQKEDVIRWNELEDLDIGHIEKTTDLHTLEKVLSHLTFAKMRKEDIDRIADPAFIKLFKLSQLSMEYMQFTQNTVDNLIHGIDVKVKYFN